MIERLLQSGNGLRAHLYSHTGSFDDIDSLVICAPGMPNYPDKGFVESLLGADKQENKAFMVLYYYGYWYSSGKMTVANSAQSVVDIVSMIRSGGLTDTFTNGRMPPYTRLLSLVGYSFGANPLARALQALDPADIFAICFASPLGVIKRSQLEGVDDKIQEQFYSFNVQFLDFIKRGYKELIRFNDDNEWKRYYQGEHPDSKVDVPNAFLAKSQLHHGLEDTMIPRALFQAFANVFPEGQVHVYEGIGHGKQLIRKALE